MPISIPLEKTHYLSNMEPPIKKNLQKNRTLQKLKSKTLKASRSRYSLNVFPVFQCEQLKMMQHEKMLATLKKMLRHYTVTGACREMREYMQVLSSNLTL